MLSKRFVPFVLFLLLLAAFLAICQHWPNQFRRFRVLSLTLRAPQS